MCMFQWKNVWSNQPQSNKYVIKLTIMYSDPQNMKNTLVRHNDLTHECGRKFLWHTKIKDLHHKHENKLNNTQYTLLDSFGLSHSCIWENFFKNNFLAIWIKHLIIYFFKNHFRFLYFKIQMLLFLQ